MYTRRHLLGALAVLPALSATSAWSEARDVIDTRVSLAKQKLLASVPDARELAAQARGMLIMPDVVKGGLVVGGAYGEGALLVNQAGYEAPPERYFSVAAASVGLQIGVQTTSHVLFFMTDEALDDFRRSDGWEVGVDAEVTFPEHGVAAQTSSTVLQKPVIGYVFGQDGFLIGASLEGSKYSPIQR